MKFLGHLFQVKYIIETHLPRMQSRMTNRTNLGVLLKARIDDDRKRVESFHQRISRKILRGNFHEWRRRQQEAEITAQQVSLAIMHSHGKLIERAFCNVINSTLNWEPCIYALPYQYREP